MRALVICHEEAAAPAVIGRLLVERGVDVTQHVVLRADGSPPDTGFPALDGFDLVLSFGSFANAYDASVRAWVDPEVALIRSALERELPFVGVCFGGQLLAEALGGRVERAPVTEIGAVRIEVADTVADAVPAGPWFTWHEDRVVLPDDVEVLGRTDVAVQLFRRGRAVGLQFHPEAEHDLIAGWAAMGPDHLPDGLSREALLDGWKVDEARAHENCDRLVGWLLSTLVPGGGPRQA
ncbi:MAG: type 1 glutamine amidotransferase [Actinobacteria bacterium]|nr:type 1 glutamine amidotransferase [Actinomycetota bacterium]